MKTILVTGASSGIGAETVRYLSKCGYNIVMVARNIERLKEVASQVDKDSLIIPYDLRDLSSIETIFKKCEENELVLDGMVHAAGIVQDTPIRTNDIEIMQEVTTIHYYAFVELSKYFSKKRYSNDGSSIVAISSMASVLHEKGMCTYSAAKSAMDAAVGVMSKEFCNRSIRVNSILPRMVNTPMITNLGYLDSNSVKEALDPIQIAYLVEFLLSDKSKHITNAHIPVGG